ncbi:MAG: hypothetical protein Q8P67_23995, partial [archaeon]|nr:hypothetical protein [archaeon]
MLGALRWKEYVQSGGHHHGGHLIEDQRHDASHGKCVPGCNGEKIVRDHDPSLFLHRHHHYHY